MPSPPTHPPTPPNRPVPSAGCFRARAFVIPCAFPSLATSRARGPADFFLTRYSEIEGDTASRARWRASRAPRPSARRGFWACVPAWLSVLRAGTLLRKRVRSGNRRVFRDSSGGACFAMAAVAALERRKPPLPPERRRPRPQPNQA